MKKSPDTKADELRRCAEQRLNKNPMDDIPREESAHRLLHELQVHQIELEMQNEELRLARAETEASLEQFTTLYDFAPVGYFTLDREGVIRQLNLCGAKLLGSERSKFLGRNFGQFVGSHYRTAFNDLLWKVFSGQNAAGIEMELNHSDQPTRFIQIEATPDTSKQTCRMTATCITQRKQLEKEVLERRKEMEILQKKQIAAQTAAAIAHELNQPLLALASYSEAALLMLQQKNPDMEKIHHAIEASERQALRAGQSIRELLEFLRTDSFHIEAVDLNSEIRKALTLASTGHEMQFHSVCQLDDQLPPVHANRNHVQKVLLNLIHNSLEAAQEFAVPLPVVSIATRTAGNGDIAQVTVRDNGPGLTPDLARRLFESFFTTKSYGIGMGLIISRSLIEANGGKLWFDSKEETGAAFHFTLPLSK